MLLKEKKRFDYYAFGMEMPGRTWIHSDYRYGNQSSEDDDEIFKGAQNLGLREYDERIGRMFSKDPFAKYLPNKSPYTYAGNSPITFIDENGGFQISAKMQKKYPKLNGLLKTISNYVNSDPSLNNPMIRNFITSSGMSMDSRGLREALRILSYGSGPMVLAQDYADKNGRYDNGTEFINIAVSRIDQLENANDAGNEVLAMKLGVMFTAIHEGVHYADYNWDGNSDFNTMLTDINGGVDIGHFNTLWNIGIYGLGYLQNDPRSVRANRPGVFGTPQGRSYYEWLSDNDSGCDLFCTTSNDNRANFQNARNFFHKYQDGTLVQNNYGYVNGKGFIEGVSKLVKGISFVASKIRDLFHKEPSKLRSKF